MPSLEYRKNLELIRLLSQLNWTPERLAKEVNAAVGPSRAINTTTPYHWRDRGRVPRAPYDRVVCEVLSRATGTPVAYDQLWSRRGARTDGARELDIPLVEAPWTPEAALVALSVAAEGAVMLHRPADVISAAALHSAGQRWAHVAAHPPTGSGGLEVGSLHLGALRLASRTKHRLDAACGGGLVKEAVRAEVRFAVQLLQDGSYGEATGRALYAAAAELARLAGWASYDCGEHAGAQRFFLAALRAAHVSGDRALGASVLGCLAVQATYIGDPNDAVALLSSAVGGAGDELSAGAWALQYGRMARAHARVGDRYLADNAAARAFQRLDAEPSGGPPGDRADLHGMVGESHLLLGDARTARGHLERALEGLPPGRDRLRALLTVRLAEASLGDGDREAARRAADEARRLEAGLRSPRVSAALAEFDARWAREAA